MKYIKTFETYNPFTDEQGEFDFSDKKSSIEDIYNTFKKDGIYVFSLNDQRSFELIELLKDRGDEYGETSQVGTDITIYDPNSSVGKKFESIDNIKMRNENRNMKKYWILKSKGSGPSETIFQTEEFDKDLIQKTFDMECWNLENGEDLEYGKEDGKQFYPAMLYVEKEQDVLIVHTRSGHKKQYFPKYDKDGFPVKEH